MAGNFLFSGTKIGGQTVQGEAVDCWFRPPARLRPGKGSGIQVASVSLFSGCVVFSGDAAVGFTGCGFRVDEI